MLKTQPQRMSWAEPPLFLVEGAVCQVPPASKLGIQLGPTSGPGGDASQRRWEVDLSLLSLMANSPQRKECA